MPRTKDQVKEHNQIRKSVALVLNKQFPTALHELRVIQAAAQDIRKGAASSQHYNLCEQSENYRNCQPISGA